MIECYSKNNSRAANEPLAWDNTTLKKGCTVEVNGASLQFNKCGIYEVSVDADVVSPTATSSAAVNLALQLYKNGVPQSQAVAQETATDSTSTHHLSFVTLVQVAENNSCKPCSSPTVCNVMNTQGEANILNANLVVTKLV